MKHSTRISGLLAIALALVLGCGDNSTDVSLPVHPEPPDLATKVGVLNQIEYAYNLRRIDSYNEVLDNNFTFDVAPGDVGGGVPPVWGRAEEVLLNTRLFDKNYAALPCRSIFVDIRSEEGVVWTELIPASAPDETWYQTTLAYDFTFEIGPDTYIPNKGSKATFTVRDAGTPSKHHWQLVEMSDLGGSTPVRANARAAGTEPSTWSTVKAKYR